MRQRLMFSLIAVAVLAATASASMAAPVGGDAVDPDYSFAVIDVEPAGVVRDHAIAALGERFVELWITPDQRSYVVGVHNLDDSEVPRLEREVTSVAPLRFENRPVSRSALDEFAESAYQIALETSAEVDSFGVDYEAGVVTISTPEHEYEQMLQTLREQTGAAHSWTDSSLMENGVASSAYDTPRVVLFGLSVAEEESSTANPYRAGKYLAVAGTTHNCTTSFTVTNGGNRHGLTAGHCGKNGSSVYFAGTKRGNIKNNTLWAANPALGDASLFSMTSNTTAYLFRSSTLNRKVSGSHPTSDLVKHLQVCTRGAFTNGQSCGPLSQINITTYSNTASRNVKYGYGWTWDPGGTQGGDSGAPVYRVQADGSVKAIGVHRAGNGSNTSFFTPIRVVLTQTGSILVTTS